ncbi:OmpP1/FadL family transporter [Sinimarinibacterium thermocellulolyticum]|uniref:Long-chain fatty acid transport protein n=1 Tax=Sinimarinibacterium thermocellulolyticum TaxID=3170016 RepID=A0ABV2ACT2_9GAMM
MGSTTAMKQAIRLRQGITAGMVLGILGVTAPVHATNGYFAHGYSVSQRALGGAGTALTEDALIVTINPAGSAWVGNRFDASLSFFSPHRDYTTGPRGADAANSILRIEEGRLSSDNEMFYIPSFAYTRRLDDVSTVGIAMYGNGGLNTEYHGNSAHFAEGFAVGAVGVNLIDLETQCEGTFGGGAPLPGETDTGNFCGDHDQTASVNLIQLFIVPHYARKLGERSSIGIAPVLAGQRFRADGLRAFAQFSNAPDRVSGNGYDLSYGYGARIGVLTGLIPGLGLGAAYQSRIRMTEFDKYAGLFAEEGDFDIPSTWNVGLSVHVNPDVRFAVDYQRINFSEIRSVGNPFDPNDFVNQCARARLLAGLGFGGSTDPSPSCLGSATGPGFGWQDVSVLKFGAQYRFAAFKFRLGYSKAEQPIPASEVLFNILAPAVPEEHFVSFPAAATT